MLNLTTLALGLTCCVSSKPEAQVVRTVYTTPPLYFPKFPEPNNSLIIPLDENNKKVTDNETDIINVLMPYWYWQLIIKYKLDVDDIETFYKACQSSPERYTPIN